jgi:hypothetical protein
MKLFVMQFSPNSHHFFYPTFYPLTFKKKPDNTITHIYTLPIKYYLVSVESYKAESRR